jgi:putative transposase
MAHAKGKVIVTVAQRAVLEALVRAYTTPQHIAQRARIVLMSADGKHNIDQAAELGVDAQRIHRWRTRWADAQAALAAAEASEGESAYIADLVGDLLRDGQRAGRKPQFTAEQVAQIIAVACERPAGESDRPVTHWTPKELAAEVIKRGIVVTISPRHIARFFRGGRSQATSVALLAERQGQGHRSRGLRARRHRGL